MRNNARYDENNRKDDVSSSCIKISPKGTLYVTASFILRANLRNRCFARNGGAVFYGQSLKTGILRAEKS